MFLASCWVPIEMQKQLAAQSAQVPTAEDFSHAQHFGSYLAPAGVSISAKLFMLHRSTSSEACHRLATRCGSTLAQDASM